MSRMRVFVLAVFVAFSVAMVMPVWADVIITKTGEKYEGYVVRETETEIVLNLPDQGVAELPIKKSDIIKHTKAGDNAADSQKDGGSKATAGSTASGSKSKGAAKKTAVKKVTPKKTTAKKPTPPKAAKKPAGSEPSDSADEGGSEKKGSSEDKGSRGDREKKSEEE